MSVVYSPLCDTDSAVYYAYLFAQFCNGAGVVGNCGVDGGVNVGESGNGCCHAFSRAFSDFGGQFAGGAKKLALLDASGPVHGLDDSAGGGVACGAIGGSNGGPGLAGGFVGGSRGCVVDNGGSAELLAEPARVAAKVVRVGERVVAGPGLMPRGPNFHRNQANRLRKKEAKAKARSGAVEKELSGAGDRPSEELDSSGRLGLARGFFSDCTDDVRRELRDTRAKLLIAENKRRLVQEERKLAELTSPMACVGEALRYVRMAQKLEEGKKSAIAGWAKTVISSHAESVARSAPSTIASLDSVKSVRSLATLATSVSSQRGGETSVPVFRGGVFEPGRSGEGCTLPFTAFENYVVSRGAFTKSKAIRCRNKLGRPLKFDDLVACGCPQALSDSIALSPLANDDPDPMYF